MCPFLNVIILSLNWVTDWPMAALVCILLTLVAQPTAMYICVALIQI